MLWHKETHINPQRNQWIIVDPVGIELATSRLRQPCQLPVVQHVRFMPLKLCQKLSNPEEYGKVDHMNSTRNNDIPTKKWLWVLVQKSWKITFCVDFYFICSYFMCSEWSLNPCIKFLESCWKWCLWLWVCCDYLIVIILLDKWSLFQCFKSRLVCFGQNQWKLMQSCKNHLLYWTDDRPKPWLSHGNDVDWSSTLTLKSLDIRVNSPPSTWAYTWPKHLFNAFAGSFKIHWEEQYLVNVVWAAGPGSSSQTTFTK